MAALEARLAEALEQAGRYEEAIRHAERAEELLVGLDDRLAAARAAATRAQAISLGLRDNDAAIALYEKAGYVREGYRAGHYRLRDGRFVDVILMAKQL